MKGSETKGRDFYVLIDRGSHTNARLSENIDATFAVAGRYQSEVYRDALNDPFLKSDSYWVTNARMSLYFGDDLELTAWGKNLEDKRYVTMGLNGLVLGGGFRIY